MKDDVIEFLVEFDVHVPDGTPDAGVRERNAAEAARAAELANEGHLVRLWKPPVAPGETKTLGLYRAASRAEMDGLLSALPLYEWMDVTVTALGRHPNDPASATATAAVINQLPDPRLTLVYRLEATLGQPQDLGNVAQGHRRIVPLIGGTFTGPELNGKLVPGASADWQIILPDGTALGDVRYTLQTDRDDVLYVQSRGVRYGSAKVLERLGRGETVDPAEYTFRTATQIEMAATDLDWLNRGVCIGVAGRQAAGVTYETYIVR